MGCRLHIIDATGPSHGAILREVASQLSNVMTRASGAPWPVTFGGDGQESPAAAADSIVVASMIDDVAKCAALDMIAAPWREEIARHRANGQDRIILPTVFRSVDDGAGGTASIERIRRLNRMAIALSAECGVELADVDRLLAWCGARVLQCDYRCSSEIATRLAAHVITAAILAGPIKDVDPSVQESAAQAHGGVHQPTALLRRYRAGGSGS